MSFTVNDLQDLLRLLDEHPDWREALRQQVLTEELLAMPARVQEARARDDERFERSERRMERIEAALEQLTQRVDALTERMEALTQRVDQLTDRLDRLTERVDRLVEVQQGMETRLGRLEGWQLGARYRDRATGYFGPMIARGRVLDRVHVADLLDDALDSGLIDAAQRHQVVLADIVMTGRRPEDRTEIYLLAEISLGVELEDVDKAADRAAILARLGRPVISVVAGERITGPAVQRARDRGVQQLLDGTSLN